MPCRDFRASKTSSVSITHEEKEMSERAQRPRPERTRPSRDPNDILRGRAFRPADVEPADPISRSVGIGYRIVEQYLEQSRGTAAGVSPRAASGDGNILSDLTSRMVRTTADLFEVWFQLVDATGVARAQAAAAPEQPPPGSAAPPSPTATAVVVQLTSSQRATVAVDLRPTASGRRLSAASLRSEDETLPRITGVVLTPSPDGGPVTIAVTIPPVQPPGVYNGMILDAESSVPVGTLSVRIDPGHDGN
jgi:hypothetical protein